MIQEVAEEAGPERKGSAPPVAPPDGDTCRRPAPEPGPALGKLEGREEEVLREGQEKKWKPGHGLAACSDSSKPLVPARPG